MAEQQYKTLREAEKALNEFKPVELNLRGLRVAVKKLPGHILPQGISSFADFIIPLLSPTLNTREGMQEFAANLRAAPDFLDFMVEHSTDADARTREQLGALDWDAKVVVAIGAIFVNFIESGVLRSFFESASEGAQAATAEIGSAGTSA